jgi:hypothetical protein
MAGKKKITVELIEESTKPELVALAKRLGVEDQLTSKMLKPEVYEIVLTEFLSQQDEEPEETTEDGTEDAAPADTAADIPGADGVMARLRAARKAKKAAAMEPAPEPEPEPEPEPKPKFSYHLVSGGQESVVGRWDLRGIRHRLGIKPDELEILQAQAAEAGEASVLKVRSVKSKVNKITFIVRRVD